MRILPQKNGNSSNQDNRFNTLADDLFPKDERYVYVNLIADGGFLSHENDQV